MGCDNQAVLQIINNGKAKDKLLQQLLRQLMFELASHQAEIIVHYVPTKENVIPDILSRWTTDQKYQQKFYELKEDHWQEYHVLPHMFELNSTW